MIILGVDLGHARTGLAISDKQELIATPLKVIQQRDEEKICQEIANTARESNVELLAVGLPRNMDGSEGESAQFAREMGARIGELTGLPVEFVDERGSTITAHGYLTATNTPGKKRKAVVDMVAAAVILENFLLYRKNHGIK